MYQTDTFSNEGDKMTMRSFMRGIMTGVMIGTVVGIVMDPTRSTRDTNSMKRKASRIFKTAGSIIENLTDF